MNLTITAGNVVAGTGSMTESSRAGQTITAGQVVYRAANGKFMLADNDAGAAIIRAARGIALNNAYLNQPLTILTGGPITIGATLTPGTAYYLSGDPGMICTEDDVGVGDDVVLIGLAATASVINVDIMVSGVSITVPVSVGASSATGDVTAVGAKTQAAAGAAGGAAAGLGYAFVSDDAYYVRSGGSNGAAGSTGAPWATIAYGLTQLAPGDTLIIGDGEWPAFSVSVNGSAGNPITIQSENLHGAWIHEDTYAAILVTGDYVTLDGLRVTNRSRHGVETQYCHHFTARNMLAEDCGGNGLGNLGGDFYTFENNICRRNGRTGWNSGISVYHPDHRVSGDTTTPGTERNIFRNNECYENHMLAFVYFNTGTIEIVQGDIVTVGGASGIADRIELTSGSWAADNAVGRVGLMLRSFVTDPDIGDLVTVGGITHAIVTGDGFGLDEGMFTDGNGMILDDWTWAQSDHKEIAFRSGSVAIAPGDVVTIGGDSTATVDSVWIASGTLGAGTAAGFLRVIVSADGAPVDGEAIVVSGQTRALVNGNAGFVEFVYPFGALVEGNLVYSNGGKGIAVYGVIGTPVVRNNTLYANNLDAIMSSETWRGDLSAQDSSPIFANNIVVCTPGPNVNAIGAYSGGLGNDVKLYNNVTFTGIDGVTSVYTFNSTWSGSGNQFGINPRLVDVENGDFRPASNSVAVDAADETRGFTTPDINGDARTAGNVNIGALEAVGAAYVPPARTDITDVGTVQNSPYGSRTNTTVTGTGGLQAGDVVYAFEAIYRGFDDFLLAVTPPAGFVSVHSRMVGFGNAAGWMQARIWRKIVEEGDPIIGSNLTFTHATAFAQFSVKAYRGVDLDQPEDTLFFGTTGSLTTRTWPSLTTYTEHARLVAYGVDFGNGSTPAGLPAVGMTERLDVMLSYLADVTVEDPATVSGLTNHANSGGTGEFTEPNAGIVFAVRAAIA